MLTTSFVFVSVLASSLTEEPEGPTSKAAQGRQHIVVSKEVADEACGHDDSSDEFTCRDVLVPQFTVTAVNALDPGVDAEFDLNITGDLGCLSGSVIDIGTQETRVEIDWSGATFVVDGLSSPAVPGFTRNINSSLIQRNTVVLPGTRAKESVWSVHDSAICLSAGESAKTSSVLIPYKINGLTKEMAWTVVYERVPAPQKTLLQKATPPPRPMELKSKFWGYPYCSIANLSVCGLLSAGLLASTAAAFTSVFATSGDIGLASSSTTACIIVGIIPASIMVFPCLIGAGIDQYFDHQPEYTEEELERDTKIFKSYVEAMKEHGLEVPSENDVATGEISSRIDDSQKF